MGSPFLGIYCGTWDSPSYILQVAMLLGIVSVLIAWWTEGNKVNLEYLCPKTCTHTLTQMVSSFASKLVAAERGHDLTLH